MLRVFCNTHCTTYLCLIPSSTVEPVIEGAPYYSSRALPAILSILDAKNIVVIGINGEATTTSSTVALIIFG